MDINSYTEQLRNNNPALWGAQYTLTQGWTEQEYNDYVMWVRES